MEEEGIFPSSFFEKGIFDTKKKTKTRQKKKAKNYFSSLTKAQKSSMKY